ncbi:ABC transporter permease [uncultured Jatrophihabitans sp.]|uniref:ABC transporter permease n=1 Tax=uncultured Jatrophihabitans sp. TaxID=1610747 RepID=UPI0035CBFE84
MTAKLPSPASNSRGAEIIDVTPGKPRGGSAQEFDAPLAPPVPGLQRAGARLPVVEYLQRLWQRRWFIAAYTSASRAAGYEGSFLGQAWQLLTPLLNIGVYYLIFGLLLNTSRGVPNFIAFLSVGVFVFTFCTSTLTVGAKAVTGNLGLVRALQFPRAVLPMSTTLVALMQLLTSCVVLVPILLLSGVYPSPRWVLLVPAIALQTMFCLGLAFVVARIGAQVPDATQLLPFISRVWMYMSGVMYSVQVFTRGHPALGVILRNNPGYVYLELARNALLPGQPASVHLWLLGLLWAVGTLVFSFLYFWRGEEQYGNV